MISRNITRLGLLGVLAVGCIVDVSLYPYDRCYSGDSCTGGTVCTTSMYSVTGSPGRLCTAGCTNAAQCPASSYYQGYAPTCVVSASAGTGLCYNSCVGSGDCYAGTTCVMVPGTGVGGVPAVRICVPST